MASKALTNAYVSLGGIEFSTYVKSVSWNRTQDAIDETTMGMTTKSNLPGLKDWQIQLDMRADYADNLQSEDADGLFGTVFAIAIRPENTTISAGNPEWQAYGMITSEDLIKGEHGQLAMVSMTIVPAGGANAAIVRDVTA